MIGCQTALNRCRDNSPRHPTSRDPGPVAPHPPFPSTVRSGRVLRSYEEGWKGDGTGGTFSFSDTSSDSPFSLFPSWFFLSTTLPLPSYSPTLTEQGVYTLYPCPRDPRVWYEQKEGRSPPFVSPATSSLSGRQDLFTPERDRRYSFPLPGPLPDPLRPVRYGSSTVGNRSGS